MSLPETPARGHPNNGPTRALRIRLAAIVSSQAISLHTTGMSSVTGWDSLLLEPRARSFTW